MRLMRIMRLTGKIFAIALFSLYVLSCPALAAPRGLSIAECVGIAMESHPSLKEAKAFTRQQEAELEGLKANDRFTFGAGASYGYADSSAQDGDNSYSVSASGSKTIYDSGRNRLSKNSQQISIRQAGEGEADTRLAVITGVKRAYYDLLLAHKNLEVAQDKLRNLSDHLERARGYYEVGSRPRIDVTKAEVDVANARVSVLSAEAGVKLANEALLVAMGSMEQEPFELSTPLEAPGLDADALRDTEFDLRTRPDWQRASLSVLASDIRIQSAARSNAPTVTASTGTSYSGREFPLSDAFNVNLRVDFPIYDGGERDAAVDAARAQKGQAEAALEALTQNIVYEVRQSVLDLQNAQERISAADEVLQYARENLDLAQGRYNAGVGSPLEVSDAVSELSQATFTRYQALYDAQTAVVSLEKATGAVRD